LTQRYSEAMDALVIFAACDGPVTAPDGSIICATARHVAGLLGGFSVPVVFISDEAPASMVRLQRDLGIRQPFIAAGGARVYVPRGYFPDVLDAGGPDDDPEWQVLRLHPRTGDAGDAVRVLMALYRFGHEPVLFVGVGEEWTHRALLRAVDVPVIVRRTGVDQVRLRRSVPGAYLTTAAGTAGWTEAILGAAAE
jgi:predicted mannosyl-3-phosphoglycerate phosphatase (HAD superfamily)